MAKLPRPMCWRTIEVESLFMEGRGDEALVKTKAFLRQGVSTGPFLALVASLLETDAERLNTPRKRFMKHWIKIGRAYDQLLSQGLNGEQALERLQEGGMPGQAAGYEKRSLQRVIKAWKAGNAVE